MIAQFWIKDEDFVPLRDKVVVVTGGSSGIGLATIEVLLANGAKVVMGDLNDAPINHDHLTFVKTNVTSFQELKALFKTAKDKYQRIDHVFSNAGISGRAKYLEDKFDENGELLEPETLVYDINLRGMINTSYLGLHHMRHQDPPGGSIVCTASGSSFQRFSIWDYTTAKHGVLGWMRGAIPNLLQQKLPIRINCIGPSWTLTGLVPKEMCEAAGVETQPAEAVGRQVAYLMADETRQGQFIYSAGGRNYEVEEGILIPTAWEINNAGGVVVNEQEAIERLQSLAAKIGYEKSSADEQHAEKS